MRSSSMAVCDSMAGRYFEPTDVERLIPELTRVMGSIMRANEQATAIGRRLEEERERIGLAGGGVIDRAAWKADMDEVTRLTETIKTGLTEIMGMGGTIKDLALGLVDFPHRRGGGVVDLGWKYRVDSGPHQP